MTSKGEQRMTKTEICPGCKGKGKIKCPVCKGKGTHEKRGNIFEQVDCPGCHGTGELVCKMCGGVGKLLAKD
jgi:DnaJ-class molecular chaperone